MLKNILLEVEYDGTNYFGWQVQNSSNSKVKNPKLTTIQGELESAIEKLFRKKIRVTYAGRTDRGVHAKGQCVNFKIDTGIPFKNIKNALNSFLPEDIRVKKIKSAPPNFHSRFSAKSKTYRYIIFNRKEPSVFLNRYAWHLPYKIDIEKMKKASLYLKGKKDFSRFARQAATYKSCVRTVKNISIKKRGSLIYIDIEADGFLRNMARNIVTFLIMIGRKEILPKDINRIMKGEIKYTNNPAPPGGLYLIKVNYVDNTAKTSV